ncbi:hypothetical protein HF690_12800 [Oleiagrimonas citrea]|uniref:Uncharacterized protein n=1 Tax=Oleiagrimonas citrea TaxID=1665687 RepID=A0A846ZQN1_9GAMM|nr:hypothetical protein [Oleiagrimonas citrea]NKZ39828.1 hypothetical protein [Oleiagrimonas citrea]
MIADGAAAAKQEPADGHPVSVRFMQKPPLPTEAAAVVYHAAREAP